MPKFKRNSSHDTESTSRDDTSLNGKPYLNLKQSPELRLCLFKEMVDDLWVWWVMFLMAITDYSWNYLSEIHIGILYMYISVSFGM